MGLLQPFLTSLFFPQPGISDPTKMWLLKLPALTASTLNKENPIWHQKANSQILVSHLLFLLVQYIRLFADLYLGRKKSFRPKVILLSGVDIADVSSL